MEPGPELGIAIFASLFLSFSSIPAFLVFLDYHRRTDIHRSILYVVAFFGTMSILVTVAPWFLLHLALLTPVLLFAFVFLKRKPAKAPSTR